ncbi:drugs-transport transmembrane ATP-binding protein ABC transporter [Corynebacterium suranareeae]|uniref:Drugs-transport transmembrane ATP-binding protein ABC transporter n=1 Tax=Corynebacterium suranareeae TaxID=2506452 RepID=A0A169S096_9CORY|nr:ABC transporter ATP-binding protein [Corynebacterium suranareeae]BAU96448.1 drugs-transport transmembrane ATP-binding protein ABC transporter [Corynebacterium suranareeae]
MIRAILALLPEGSNTRLSWHLVLTALSVLCRALSAVLLVPLVSALFSTEPQQAWLWLGAITTVTVLGWIVDWAAARHAYQIGFGILDNGQRSLADTITIIQLNWFDAKNTSTTRQAIAATGPDLVGVIVYFVTPLISAILLPLIIAVALVPFAWQLGAAALIGILALLGTFWLSQQLTRQAVRAAMNTNNQLTERVLEFARTQQALRAARRVELESSLAGQALGKAHSSTMKNLTMQVPGQILFSLVSQLTLVVLAGLTVYLTLTHQLTVPVAIALLVVAVRYLESFTVFAELSPGVEAVTTTLRNIREVLEAPRDPEGDGTTDVAKAPSIELRDVSFNYGSDASGQVLEHFNLQIQPGSTTAIVGPSGSGKSTVLSLIAGLQQPSSGDVLVNGQTLHTLSSDARRNLVSVVFQEPYLFDGSLKSNVLIGQPDATDLQVNEASQLARVDRIIHRLPDGWDSRAGEGGVSLSGGERQRLSIARALIKPAPILLVDEATSALDPENEAAVAAALSDDPIPRTRVMVAHRLSSISAADRVIFLDKGKIIEDGSIPDLLAQQGRFADFWTQHHSAEQWQLGAR